MAAFVRQSPSLFNRLSPKRSLIKCAPLSMPGQVDLLAKHLLATLPILISLQLYPNRFLSANRLGLRITYEKRNQIYRAFCNKFCILCFSFAIRVGPRINLGKSLIFKTLWSSKSFTLVKALNSMEVYAWRSWKCWVRLKVYLCVLKCKHALKFIKLNRKLFQLKTSVKTSDLVKLINI